MTQTLKQIQEDGEYFRKQLGSSHGVLVTYTTITPESAEDGDSADNGYHDYDSFESSEDESAVKQAIEYLRDHGANEPSSSHFHSGIWYSTEYQTKDYSSGEQIQYAYHLHNFNDMEQLEVFAGVTRKPATN